MRDKEVSAADPYRKVRLRPALAKSLKSRGITLALAGLRDDIAEDLKAIGAEQDLGPIAAHRTIDDCLQQPHVV